MWWELCNGSSEYLVDVWGKDDASWQAAKKHFKEKGYCGDFLLIYRARGGGFKVYHITIPINKENKHDK